MAQDVTLKARGIALGMMASAEKLISALDEFAAFLLEKEGAGIDWTAADVVTMLEGDGQLKHITAATLNNAHTQATNIYNAMKNGGTLVANVDDVFQALRP
jgi:hypothetical protein